MKKEIKRSIPLTMVGVDTDADIVALRNMLEGSNNVEVREDGTLSVKGRDAKPGKKKGDIPKGVLGVVLPFGRKQDPSEDNIPEELVSEFRTTQEEPAEGDKKKKGVIPKGVMGTDSLQDMVTDTTPVPEPATDEQERADKPDPDKKKALGDVPKGVLGTPQWYARPDMKQQLEFEMKSMEPFVGKPKWGENCGVLDDGRMYWKVRQRIKADRKNGNGSLYDTNYEILLVYEPNHPSGAWGTSVHAYLKAPNDLNKMQQRVNMSPRSPKNIPHVLVDSNGMKYLCTAHMNDFGTNYSDPRGVPTAKTAMLAAIKWLHNFECGLLSQDHWYKFQQHGVI